MLSTAQGLKPRGFEGVDRHQQEQNKRRDEAYARRQAELESLNECAQFKAKPLPKSTHSFRKQEAEADLDRIARIQRRCGADGRESHGRHYQTSIERDGAGSAGDQSCLESRGEEEGLRKLRRRLLHGWIENTRAGARRWNGARRSVEAVRYQWIPSLSGEKPTRSGDGNMQKRRLGASERRPKTWRPKRLC